MTLVEELHLWEGEYHYPSGLLTRAADEIKRLLERKLNLDQIIYTKANAKDIAKTIDLIRPVVTGMDSNIVSMSCIAIAVLMQKPDIELPLLIDTIKNTSEHIALTLMEPINSSIN